MRISNQKPEVGTCSCDFGPGERELERAERQRFLREHGEGLPEDAIQRMTADEFRGNWATRCSCDKPKEIIAAAHYEPLDWFLCGIKGLAVKEVLRWKGIGRQMTQEIVEKASRAVDKAGRPRCLVLAADVTYDNVRSLRCLRRAGFEHVGEFCWAKGEKPADILHLARFKPTKDKACLKP